MTRVADSPIVEVRLGLQEDETTLAAQPPSPLRVLLEDGHTIKREGSTIVSAPLSGEGGGGSVTSVDITPPADGITASGGPITTSGAITLTLADDLAALEALAGTNNIYYRSASSTWTSVTIGTGLSFAGGTLSSTITGTVTSVNLTAPAAGINVSGGPITTSGSITLSLDDDLAALEGLTGTNTIYYRSGADTWTDVTIGGNLIFSGGTLSATPTGSGTEVQFRNSAAFGGDADFTWDSSNNILNLGQCTATTKGILSVTQPSTRPALLLVGTGTSAGSPSSTTAGIAMWMTWNNTGNRQFVIGNSDNFGNASSAVFRYLTGTALPNIDGITGDGNTRTSLALATDTTGVAIGNTSLAYNVTLLAKCVIYAEASGVGLNLILGSSGTGDLQRWSNNAGTAQSVITSLGNLGARRTSASAFVHLGAGTTAASTAPLKFTAGSYNTTAEAGAIEYDGYRLSVSSDGLHRTYLAGVIFTQVQTVTIANTTSETTGLGTGIGSLSLPANSLRVGKTLRVTLMGYMSFTGTVTLTPKLKLGSTLIDTGSAAPSLSGTVINQSWKFEALCTVYSIGAGGTLWTQGFFTYGTSTTAIQGFGRENTSTVSLDTTASQTIDFTFTWSVADAGNTITITNVLIEVLN